MIHGTQEAWASIAVTDRPGSLAALGADLADSAASAAQPLRLFIIDNGRGTSSASAILEIASVLRTAGIRVQLDRATRSGGSVAESRLDQRAQVARAIAALPPPAYVWMLDDDVRLDHAVVSDDGRYENRQFVNPFALLRDVAVESSRPDVLLGVVTGDPPIPPVATYASRYADLLNIVERLFALDPAAPWLAQPRAARRLAERDHYYDFSDARTDGYAYADWFASVAATTVADVATEVLAAAADIPFGVAFSRPLVQRSHTAHDAPGIVRGASAAFFDLQAFVEHPYPSTIIADVPTRRCDTLGARILRRRGRSVAARPGFAVRHVRVRDPEHFPTSERLAADILGDTFGACLTRVIDRDPSLARSAATDFLRPRAERIAGCMRGVHALLPALSGILARAPSWLPAGDVGRLLESMRKLRAVLPLTRDGELAPVLAAALRDEGNIEHLVAFGRRLADHHDLEAVDHVGA